MLIHSRMHTLQLSSLATLNLALLGLQYLASFETLCSRRCLFGSWEAPVHWLEALKLFLDMILCSIARFSGFQKLENVDVCKVGWVMRFICSSILSTFRADLNAKQNPHNIWNKAASIRYFTFHQSFNFAFVSDWMRARAAGGVPDAPRGRRGWRGQAHRLLWAARQLHHRDGEARAMQGPVRLHHRERSAGGTARQEILPTGEKI